ncbi:hypothetical protein NDN08_006017 [Rhodosorus marinus]|uniref:HAUS augmin-like complex subunit 5 n=1 Tax=Rhodosorus marinus TaxID=101924 RepID=A0AAV8UNC6_9RHOD|nr:hypothetical protein NDN08_006017 [Rhodosorus marinus]
MELPEKVSEWATSCLGMKKVPEREVLKHICRGRGAEIMQFLVERLKSKEHADLIRANLRLNGVETKGSGQSRSERKTALLKRRLQYRDKLESLQNDINKLQTELSFCGHKLVQTHGKLRQTGKKQALMELQRVQIQNESKQMENILEELSYTVEKASTDLETIRSPAADVRLTDAGNLETELVTELSGARKQLLKDLQLWHVHEALACQQLKVERENAENEIVERVKSVQHDPIAILEVIARGEIAALKVLRSSGEIVCSRINELAMTLSDSVESISTLANMMGELRQQRQLALETRTTAISTWDSVKQMNQRIEYSFQRELIAQLEESKAHTQEQQDLARMRISRAQCLDLAKHARVQLSIGRVPRSSLYVTSTMVNDDLCTQPHGQGSQPAIEGVGGDRFLLRVAKAFRARDDGSKLETRAAELERIEAPIAISSSTETLRRLNKLRDEQVDEFSPHLAQTAEFLEQTIPRVANDAAESLKTWWEQPVRRAAQWKRVSGRTLQESEQRLASVMATQWG